MAHPARWWRPLGDNRIVCELCPQVCIIPDGATGNCGARFVEYGQLCTNAWGVGTYPVADPIEKKPLYHFLPGSSVLSFGLFGCNLSCSFCQNWRLSSNHDYDSLQSLTPEKCVKIALEHGCSSLAFTYNEPAISSEFCIEVSKAARQAGLRTVAVSNGYIHNEARSDLFDVIDATNIDIKSINADFYSAHCGGRLEPVLETLVYLTRSKRIWVELTNLLIPSLNDSDSDIDSLARWIGANLGYNVPLHFSAFHPEYRMQNLPRTPYNTLRLARERALVHGLKHVYIGNTPQPQITFCPHCQGELVRREGYNVSKHGILTNKCPDCAAEIAGVF